MVAVKTHWAWPKVVTGVVLGLAVWGGGPWPASAWDYAGHRLVALLALRTLPTNFPVAVASGDVRERVAFLSGEPDRWRNSVDAPFGHAQKPDHFFDLDELPLYDLSARTLSPFRYEAEAQFVAGRLARPEQFPKVDPAHDPERTRGRIGFLPWAITEHQGRLKSCFSYWRVYAEAGAPAERANAEQNIVYTMGVMAHFVGDAVQPLHTTRHYNGWVGVNPSHYTTNRTFHGWIDGGYPERLNLSADRLAPRLREARRVAFEEFGVGRTNLFPVVLGLLERSHRQVEPLYQLERDGHLGTSGDPAPPGRALIERQIVEGAQWLGDLWLTAWQDAPPDYFLKAQLAKRRLGSMP